MPQEMLLARVFSKLCSVNAAVGDGLIYDGLVYDGFVHDGLDPSPETGELAMPRSDRARNAGLRKRGHYLYRRHTRVV